MFRNKNIRITFSIVKALVTKASFRIIIINTYKAFSKSIIKATFIKTCSNYT
jgi:putative component of membrane protein insertase Oxa1/YidC/SpoIIIJ protein YidD